MNKILSVLSVLIVLVAATWASPASAQSRVICESVGSQYNECDAPWASARLVEQLSRTRCVQEDTWGFNARTQRIWVSRGCRASFASADARARPNPGRNTSQGYDGCHGLGCRVDNPDDPSQDIDPRPQFDRDGNPNFDENGNWIGCTGMGCYVDDPDNP